jgi:hypothetical protein
LCKKAKFAPHPNFAFLLALKRQNIRALQARLTRLKIEKKRQKQIRLHTRLRVALEGNQLKRLHPSLKSPSAAPQIIIEDLKYILIPSHKRRQLKRPTVFATKS